MDMMGKCEELRDRLSNMVGGNSFDMLYEYRIWFDKKGINSEGKDGWPLPFVFEEKNINDFVKYWSE